ncbi:HGT3 [[Candida] subhashii]|uniref:HGT3 n=1 Tax=[Candida] subhashii TaxID=561895 RepID=A0A8J5QCT0_9ASCO|nr:HGT3 [[Candida] subhashii]KAG7662676.1 HGT3 [[Candida] subhashii]
MSSLITNTYFKAYYNDPTPTEIGIMISILEIGALGSSFIAGKIADKAGRRRTIRYGSFIFIIGGTLQAASTNIWYLSLGRLIAGVAIGFLTTVVPCYQSEISPSHHRGFYACLEFTGLIIGYSSSIWVDYAFSYIESDWSWRSPLILQVAIGMLLYLGTFVIVETPRWLLDHDHDVEGMIVIADLYANGDVEEENAKDEYRNIKESVLIDRIEGGERSYKYLFQRYAKRLSVACFSQMFAQFNGINLISYYAPLIFESAGWVGREAILMTGINSIIYIISTIPPWFLVDDWGRKPLLLSGAILMGLPLYIAAYSLFLNNSFTPVTVVACMSITMAAFGYSWGPIPWLMSEVFPNSVRSKGAAVSTATNWLCNFIVGFGSPILLDLIKWKTYLIPATSCAISFFAVGYLFPETKGISLEDMGSIFDDKSSIFSYHSNGTPSGASNRSIRHFDSENGSNSDILQQSHASLVRSARSPTPLMRQELEGNSSNPQITTPLLKPDTMAPLMGSVDASLPIDNSVVQEIEPPSFEQIIRFKAKQYRKPNRFTSLLSRHKRCDCTSEECSIRS